MKLDKKRVASATDCFVATLVLGPPVGALLLSTALCLESLVSNATTEGLITFIPTFIGFLFFSGLFGYIPAFISAILVATIVYFKERISFLDSIFCGIIGGIIYGFFPSTTSKIFFYMGKFTLGWLKVNPEYSLGNIIFCIFVASIIWLNFKIRKSPLVG